MSFSPIYKNFQHLLAENSGVFKLFKKTKNPGMYQAVWQARQAEIDTYKERLNQVESKLDYINSNRSTELKQGIRNTKDLEAKLLGQEETNNTLKSRLALSEKQSEIDNEELARLRSSCERFKIENQSLQRQMKEVNLETLRGQDGALKLKEDLHHAHNALVKLNDQHQKLSQDHDELSLENDKLSESLDKSKHYAKEFRRINGRMENELHRVNNELEKVQGLS
jgi:chromosome segregation ATPase